jgi:hypothetical protein
VVANGFKPIHFGRRRMRGGARGPAPAPASFAQGFRQSMARFSPPDGTEYIAQPILSPTNSRTVELP